MPHVGEMHKREWFAGQAMLALLSHPTRMQQQPGESDEDFALRVAIKAYQIADALVNVGYRKDSRH